MKLRQFFILLRVELFSFPLLIAIAYSGWFSWFGKTFIQEKHMFDLGSHGPEMTLMMIMYFAFNALFFSGTAGFITTAKHAWTGLSWDFLFARAIDRRILFGIKSSLFIAICAMPLVTTWVYSYSVPTIRMGVPSYGKYKNTIKDFYLGEFKDAYVQKSSDGRIGGEEVVIPQGQIKLAVYKLFSGVLSLLLFETISFFSWPKGWGFWLAFGVCLLVPFLGIFTHRTPSRYESGFALVANHPFLACLMLVFLFVGAQLYCGWKFIRTELLS